MSDYWGQFTPTVSFLEPCRVAGIVEVRETFKGTDGAAPRLRLRLDSGRSVWVNVVQTRLLEELVRKAPNVGDRVEIIYKGTAQKAAPGMSPTKEFDVTVERAKVTK